MFDNIDDLPGSYEGFFSGLPLAYILHDLDPTFDVSILVNVQNEHSERRGSSGLSLYTQRKANITAVYKGLFRFIRRSIPELRCQYKKFDFPRIAEAPQPKGISQVCFKRENI